ncbi:hypothetical protein ACOMHN_053889 [Nucella lapillus]
MVKHLLSRIQETSDLCSVPTPRPPENDGSSSDLPAAAGDAAAVHAGDGKLGQALCFKEVLLLHEQKRILLLTPKIPHDPVLTAVFKAATSRS